LSVREQRLLGYLAVARYLSADQLQRIVGDHGERRVFSRRLRRIAAADNGIPLIRVLAFPDRQETWALTAAGWQTAEKGVPHVRPPPAKDIGGDTLRHHHLLTEVFVELVLSFRKYEDDPVTSLPFRWIPESAEYLNFSVHDRSSGLMTNSGVQPDAILEVPGLARRFFIEAETGARHTGITTGNVMNTAALMRKLQRYGTYFTGFVDGPGNDTWYTRRFSKELFPEVTVLVHSAGRKERVQIAVAKWMGHATTSAPFSVRILTFDEAASALGGMISGVKAPTSRILAVPEKVAFRIRDGFNVLSRAYNELRAVVDAHNRAPRMTKIFVPVPPRDAIVEMAKLIRHTLLGEPRGDVNWASHLLDDGKRLGP
jgi:hypothetical protein